MSLWKVSALSNFWGERDPPEAVALLPLQRPRGAGALTHARTGPGCLGEWLGRTAPETINRSAHQRLDSPVSLVMLLPL